MQQSNQQEKRDQIMKVLNFGSMNIDYVYDVEQFVQGGQTISSKDMNIFSGGKGLNSSIALSKAGVCVEHAGAIGTDGLFLLNLMKGHGIGTKYVQVMEEEKTGHAIIQKNKDGENCILLYGGANQRIEKEYIDQVLDHFEKGDLLVLQNEVSNLKYIVEQAHKKGMIIVLNPSPMDEKILDLDLNKIDICVLNEHEAKSLQGFEHLKNLYPKMQIVLTLGSQGSLHSYKEEMYQQEAYKVHAIDTTAAGDTFTGYFLAGLIEDKPIPQCMQRAAKAAAIAVTRLGAAPSIPTKEEVESIQL